MTFSIAAAVLASAVLTGETSHPSHSFYAEGTKVEVEFAMSGLAPGERRTLEVEVSDERDRRVGGFDDEVRAGADGTWRKTYEMPSSRLGFYRVRAKAGDAVLPKVGSRPRGTLTYAVVHDPEKRPFIAERDAFFGIFGNPFGKADLRPWAGMHRDISGGRPALTQNEYAEECARRRKFPVYGAVLASRIWNDVARFLDDEEDRRAFKKCTWPWKLVDTPEGEALYRKALTALAQKAIARPWPHADQPRIYEIFWEPDLTMKNPEHLVKTAAIAYETIHAADANALVAVPTFSGSGSGILLKRCLDAGLGKYMDVFSIHPYVGYPPDRQDFVEKLRAMRSMIKEAKGRDVPMIATESGAGADGVPEKELMQLDGQVTCHLSTLGEGFLFHNAFHGFDYNNTTHTNGDIGIAYNLCLYTKRWEPDRVSPRPAVAGLSAASWLLDGKRPTCSIEWLSENSRGYAYADAKDNCVIALWDWTDPEDPVSLPVGRETVEVADIMGNVTRVKTQGGNLSLKLGRSPQYILDPDPSIWGRAAQSRLKWSERRRKRAADAAPVEVVEVRPVVKDGAFAVWTEIRNRTDGEIKGVVEMRVRDMPGSGVRRTFTLAPGAQSGGTTALRGVMGGPFDEHLVDTRVFVDGYAAVVKETKANFLAAPKVPRSPSGSPFVAWKDPEYHAMTMPVKRQPGLHSGPKDLSAKAAFAWSDDYLLIDIVADDDFYSQPTNGCWSWNGDCVQISLARKAVEKSTNNGFADLVEEARTETTYAFTPIGSEAYRTGTWDWKRLPVGHHGEGVVNRSDAPYEITLERKSSGGAVMRYRAAVPWRWMRMESPRGGEDVRFAISVNDLDDGVRTISAIEAFALKSVRGHGHLLLVDGGMTRSTARDKAVEVAVLGQSQPPGTRPVAWNGCAWVADDGKGNFYFPDGWMVRRGSTEAVRGERPADVLVPNVRGGICIPPADVTIGFAAKWSSLRLDRKSMMVYGTARDGSGEVAVFDYSDKLPTPKFVTCVGVLRATGDLLLGTTYPDNKVHRFTIGGKYVKDPMWPFPTEVERFGYAAGRTWALCTGAKTLETKPGARSLRVGCSLDHSTVAIAGDTTNGWWLATSQGALHYRACDPTRSVRRIGGLPDVTAIGFNDEGRVLVARGCRSFGLWSGDFPDSPLDCNQNRWLIGSRWSGSTTAIDVDDDGVFYCHDTKDGKKWGFDPRITAWTQRHLRMFPANDRDIHGCVEDPKWGLPPGAGAVARRGSIVMAWYPELKGIRVFQIGAN